MKTWWIGLALACMFGASALAEPPKLLTAPPPIKELSNLRDRRFCDILAVRESQPLHKVGVEVLSTIGVDGCPARTWEALDPTAVAEQLHTSAVILDGPRFLVSDWLRSRSLGKPAIGVQDLGVHPIASAVLLEEDGQAVRRPYLTYTIERASSYIYATGKQVFELRGPEERVYVMESYTTAADPTLTSAKLADLGSKLRLPKGWRYRVRTLTQDLEMRSSGGATLVMDDLHNIYQRFDLRLVPL